MHENSMRLMTEFRDSHLNGLQNLNILDVGSYDVNGCYRSLFNRKGWKYTGVDIQAGPNVDIVTDISDIESVLWKPPFPVYDVVISGQCLEHTKYPWLMFQAMVGLTANGGYLCVIVPWSIGEHRYPIDCWRILPDGMRALAERYCITVEVCYRSAGDTFFVGKKL